MENFAYFLDNYVVSGGDINSNKRTIGESVIAFDNQLWKVNEKKIDGTGQNKTLFVDFTVDDGYIIGELHPVSSYLPLWEIKTDGTGSISSTTDFRGNLGMLKFKNDILGIISDKFKVDVENIVGMISESKINLDYPSGDLSQRITKLEQISIGSETNLEKYEPDHQIWISQEGQSVFTLDAGKSYDPNKNRLEVEVGGIRQIDSVTEIDSTSFSLDESLHAGMVVYAKWYKGPLVVSSGHANAHKKGGKDELDVTELKNYTEKIDNRFNSLFKNNIPYNTVWEYVNQTGQAIYSTPIITTFSNGKKVLIYQGWDWYLYVHDLATGELLWRYAFGGNNYGRPQAEDVNGDGKIEIFGASHEGVIYCLDENGNRLWFIQNLYDREGNGTATFGTSNTLVDTSKSWATNSFIRSSEISGENASIQITDGKGSGQTLEIKYASGNTITTFENWTTVPDSTSKYKIIPKKQSDIHYQHAGQLSKEYGVWYLYVTGFDGQCVKIDASTGDIVWKFSSLENIEPFPIITDINNDGILECIFASVDTNIYCLRATDGTKMWSTSTGEGNDSFLSYGDIDNDGVTEIIVNSRSNRCYILNGKTGTIEHKSTDVGGDIDTQPILADINGDGLNEIVFGCDSGYVYCLDNKANTLWRFNQGVTMNASVNVLDINHDGKQEILSPDMNGTISILDGNGVEIGQIHTKGSIEGTPIVGDLDGDGKIEMVITSIDGYVKMIRFE